MVADGLMLTPPNSQLGIVSVLPADWLLQLPVRKRADGKALSNDFNIGRSLNATATQPSPNDKAHTLPDM